MRPLNQPSAHACIILSIINSQRSSHWLDSGREWLRESFATYCEREKFLVTQEIRLKGNLASLRGEKKWFIAFLLSGNVSSSRVHLLGYRWQCEFANVVDVKCTARNRKWKENVELTKMDLFLGNNSFSRLVEDVWILVGFLAVTF